MDVTIVKCGGSLLTLPDVDERLLSLLDREHLHPAVVVVGGGSAGDLVRTWDQQFNLGDEHAHQMAIHAMSLTARLLVTRHERFRLIKSIAEIQDQPQHAVSVLNPAAAIVGLEAGRTALPRSWDITSDSIAAWLAGVWRTDRLLLLKSVDLPNAVDSASDVLQNLATLGLVDPAFPEFAAGIRLLSWCNLRGDVRQVQPILHQRDGALNDGVAKNDLPTDSRSQILNRSNTSRDPQE